MTRTAVCICTFRNPDGLALSLQSLATQVLVSISPETVAVIVVDNDPERSASQVCSGNKCAGPFALHYVHEPQRGLSNARNSALDAAAAFGAGFVAFIDDDQMAAPHWLENIHRRLKESGADAAIGPVLPIFAKMPPAYMVEGGFFSRSLPSSSGFVEDGYTGNSLLNRASRVAHDLRFDRRFNETGGEDTLFFRAVIKRGGRIAWAQHAVVWESIPRDRASIGWLARRWYRTGIIEAQLGAHDARSWRGRVRSLGKGTARLGAGSLLIVGAALSRASSRRSAMLGRLYTLARGAGLLASAFGHSYREYAGNRYR
jgi:glycosyltransferase involved in cell wall biosynthesis